MNDQPDRRARDVLHRLAECGCDDCRDAMEEIQALRRQLALKSEALPTISSAIAINLGDFSPDVDWRDLPEAP